MYYSLSTCIFASCLISYKCMPQNTNMMQMVFQQIRYIAYFSKKKFLVPSMMPLSTISLRQREDSKGKKRSFYWSRKRKLSVDSSQLAMMSRTPWSVPVNRNHNMLYHPPLFDSSLVNSLPNIVFGFQMLQPQYRKHNHQKTKNKLKRNPAMI